MPRSLFTRAVVTLHPVITAWHRSPVGPSDWSSFWVFISPEGRRVGSPGQDREKWELKRDSGQGRGKERRMECQGSSLPNHLMNKQNLHRLVPVDEDYLACINLTSWPCFSSSTCSAPVLSPLLFLTCCPFFVHWISGHLFTPHNSFDLVSLCSAACTLCFSSTPRKPWSSGILRATCLVFL